MDKRSPRDGRVIEELGTYDPMCPETDARVTLKADRIDYWISVGAQPSDKVATLIKKYGTDGTHLDAQKEAIERLSKRKEYTPAPEPAKPAKKKKEEPKAEAEAAAEEAPPQKLRREPQEASEHRGSGASRVGISLASSEMEHGEINAI